MKKTILSTVLCLLVAGFANSQVKKTDVEAVLKDVGTDMESITTFVINNVYAFYTNGNSEHTYVEYSSTPKVGGTHSFEITENGFRIVYRNDVKSNISFYPYDNIARFLISKNQITIWMKQ